MRIYIDPYLLMLPQVRSITDEICDEDKFFPMKADPPQEKSWSLSWGYPATKRRSAVAETGFFWDAMHLDTLGLYQFSSLNTASGIAEIESFSAPVPARVLIEQAPLPKSKYRQPKDDTEWRGVVFACQNPTDRSVHSVASTEDWWRFYEDSCRYYGAKMYVKLHPWNKDTVEARMREIARTHGCQIGRAGHSVIQSCEHVVLFTSSFSVDCMLRGIPIKQGAPGYFSHTGAVTYCAGDPRMPLEDTVERGVRLTDFLAWRYCFSMDCSLDFWKQLLISFAQSRDIFPLQRQYSYATYLQNRFERAPSSNG